MKILGLRFEQIKILQRPVNIYISAFQSETYLAGGVGGATPPIFLYPSYVLLQFVENNFVSQQKQNNATILHYLSSYLLFLKVKNRAFPSFSINLIGVVPKFN